jgi:Fe2+ transport system protein FeoA
MVMNKKAHQQQMPLLLSEMREGQSGIIVRVGGKGPLRRRLLEMGLVKGTEIYVEKYAPLMDPLELIVKGYHVSLRVEEASQVIVKKKTGSS